MMRGFPPAGSPVGLPAIGPCAILGVAGDERVAGFDAALAGAGLPPARLLDYADFAAEPARLAALFPEGYGLLRIDSPGSAPRIRRALARLAGAEPEADEDATRLHPDHAVQGGLAAALDLARRLLPPWVAATHEAGTVALFYDKRACHAAMRAAGVPVPRALAPAGGVAALIEAMRAAGLSRVFVKPRFGSGAAGIAAVTVGPGGIEAVSAAERGAGGTLHHSRRLRRVRGMEAVALLDAILARDAHVEQWVPKAAVQGRPCDLRVLVVAGEVAHTVLRLGAGPITNLDLGGCRAEADLLRARVAPAAWAAMLDDCRLFAGLFPNTFQVALDVAFTASLRRHVVFEANAFGDLIRRVRHQGLDPYAWQVARLPAWLAARRSPGLAA
ncbi:hypothetical protein SAMN04487843_102170 [Methylobacterium sp. ap11]|uniref:STM4014 family protein n=1 Tax=Methylobacterium sp. ap11 TaxID=1761799 RepID=UPI0008D5F40D|nr:STM4014 family protein [Methylobacterium sp. ap11]SEO56216.1 hypothetical protein SAMN04487843_102170 [Methylobacterium sp. ap11]